MTREPVLPSTADWLAAGQHSVVDGDRIFWRQDGPADGTPLTLLHGFPTSSHDWAALLPALVEAGHRVTTLDLLGFGASDKPRGRPYSLVRQATIVETLWRDRGIGRTALVGHDYSVSVTQELLARDPERITSVTFLNGGIYPDLHRPIGIQRLLHGPLGPVLGRVGTERTFRAAMAKIIAAEVADEDLHALWESVAAGGGRAVQHALLRYIDERRERAERWVGAMETYAGPTQLVWGPEDPVSGRHVLDRARTRLPDARIDELSGVGHYPQVEAPDAVGTALVDFLAARGR